MHKYTVHVGYGVQYRSCYGVPNLKIKWKKMAGGWFALSNQTIIEQHPKENVRNTNMLKATKT